MFLAYIGNRNTAREKSTFSAALAAVLALPARQIARPRCPIFATITDSEGQPVCVIRSPRN